MTSPSIELNLDGTLPKKPIETKTVTCTFTTWKPCPHHTGWYFSVKFLFWTKKMYWCELCHRAFDKKFIDQLLSKHRKEKTNE